jgi:dolichol-phosphate mannosyltransferase
MPLLSFVIPVYRNEKAVTLTYQKLSTMVKIDLPNYQPQFIFVDDGSDDGSLAELLGLRDIDRAVGVISFTRNFGQMAAIQAGLRAATGDVIVQLSADLQDPVDLIPQLVKAYESGNELVIAYRLSRKDDLSNRLTSRLFYAIIRLSYPQMPSGGFDYVLMSRKVLDAFNAVQVKNQFFQGDLLWLGYKVAFIPYTREKRTIGKSQYNFAKRLKNALDAIIDSSYMPIRFVSLVGALTAVLGVLYAINITYYRLMHGSPFPGWAPLMIVILLLSGLIMVMLGIIGEYVWRIYDEVKRKPNYMIRERWGA